MSGWDVAVGTISGALIGMAGSQWTEWRRYRQEASLRRQLRNEQVRERQADFELAVIDEIVGLLEELHEEWGELARERVRHERSVGTALKVHRTLSRMRLRAAFLGGEPALSEVLRLVIADFAELIGATEVADLSSRIREHVGAAAGLLAARRARVIAALDVDNPLTSTTEAGPEGPASTA